MCVGGRGRPAITAEGTPAQGAGLHSVPPHLLLPSTVVESGINTKTRQSDVQIQSPIKKSLNRSLETQEENDLTLH